MGNCILKGFGVMEEMMVKVVTPDGGVMELYAPITAECVTNEFPGYAMFGSPHRVSPPLLHSERLSAGHYYYLLPINKASAVAARKDGGSNCPYRMSVDCQRKLLRRQSVAEAEVFPRYNSAGVWKVRLVIDNDELSEILSQEARTEALIESVRTAAKCAAAGVVPSAASSDRRSWTSAVEN